MATEYKLSYTASEIDAKLGLIDSLATKDELPSKTSELTNDSEFITETYVKNYAQPKGDYVLTSEIPSISGLASENYVNEKVAALVNSAPETLNTLDELASALGDDANFAATVTTELGKKANSADLGTLAIKDVVSKTDLESAVQSSLNKADTALQSYTETDPTVPAWAKATTKPSYSKSEVGLGNVDNVKQYSASNPPPYPVTSVNGKTGAVTLDAAAVGARPSTWMPSASDVGALPSSTTIPSKTSQLTNDSGYQTANQVAAIVQQQLGVIENGTY